MKYLEPAVFLSARSSAMAPCGLCTLFHFSCHKMLNFSLELHGEGLKHSPNGRGTLQAFALEEKQSTGIWPGTRCSASASYCQTEKIPQNITSDKAIWDRNGSRQRQAHSSVMSESRQHTNVVQATKYQTSQIV